MKEPEVMGLLQRAIDRVPVSEPDVEGIITFGFEWVTFNGRLIRTRAGMAAAAGERWDEAEEHYRLALEAVEEQPSRIEQADIQSFHARMLLDRDDPGDKERARDLLKHAAEAYREIGMPRHVPMAEAMLDKLA